MQATRTMADAERTLLGEWVRWHRKNKGWSQRDLADAIGMSRTSVQNLERGGVGRKRSPLSLARVEEALTLTPGTLTRLAAAGLQPEASAPSRELAYLKIRVDQARSGDLTERILGDIEELATRTDIPADVFRLLVVMLLHDRTQALREIDSA